MSKDHREIYLEPLHENLGSDGRQWCENNVWDDEGIKYIRSDIVEELREEIENLRYELLER